METGPNAGTRSGDDVLKNDCHIDIDRPITDVFILATDHVAAWSTIVVEDHPVQLAEDGGVGSTFRVVTEDRGHRMEFDGEVTEYDPPNRSSIVMRGPVFDLHVTYALETLPTGLTRITQTSASNAKGIWKLFFLVMVPLMRKSARAATRKELEQLRTYCESGTPATPGGPSDSTTTPDGASDSA